MGQPPRGVLVARFLSTGILDRNFGRGGIVSLRVPHFGHVTDVAVQRNRKIVVLRMTFFPFKRSTTPAMDFTLTRLLSDGSLDRHSSGTWIGANGESIPLGAGDFTLKPGETWQSKESGASYPVTWELEVPRQDLRLRLGTEVENQELRTERSTGVTYWEGAVEVQGTRASRPVRGRGYLEMTGYAGQAISEKFR
jgi:hypothetical protein